MTADKNIVKQNSNGKKSTRPVVFMVVCSVLFMVTITIGTFLYYRYVVDKSESALNNSGVNSYKKRYALICDNSEMWTEVYKSAKKIGEEQNIYVDLLSGRLDDEYSKEDLMKIAIESGVDGILLDADNTDSFRQLINEADRRSIPVVTLMTDCQDSKRKSFVQASAYNLGKLYGEQVLSMKRPADEKIVVVLDSSVKDTSQNIIYIGIQDIITENGSGNMTVSPLSIDSSDSFASEEDIRKIFMYGDTTPDVIICLDEISTAGFYQALIDYNKVGDIRLIGYYNSERVMKGIEQGVIEATVSVDTNELGKYGIDALSEYQEFGYVSEYFSVDSELIDQNNVKKYMK